MTFIKCIEYIQNIPKEECNNIRNLEIFIPSVMPKVIVAKITFYVLDLLQLKR